MLQDGNIRFAERYFTVNELGGNLVCRLGEDCW